MNENTASKRRDWVKNAAIIFLGIMLILTFFSNTIMNYSLPEVATQYVQPGSITAKIRGTGNVEATDPYSVIAKESRVISSVAVQQGDQVEKDQVLYYLEDAESEELKTAEEELEALELAYMKGMFGSNVDPAVISKVAKGNVATFSELQNKVSNMQNRLDAAKARVEECTDNLNTLSLQSSISSNDSSVSTIPYENEQSQASTALSDAQAAETEAQTKFNNSKSEKIAALNNQIAEKEKQIADLETLISNANTTIGGSAAGGSGSGAGSGGSGSAAGTNFVTEKRNAEKAVIDTLDQIQQGVLQSDPTYNGGSAHVFAKDQAGNYIYDSVQVNTVIASLEQWIAANRKDNDYQALLATFYAEKSKLDTINSNQNNVIHKGDNEASLAARKQELANLKASLESVSSMTYQPGESVKDAQNRLNQATQNLFEINNSNKQTAAAFQNKILNAEAALKNAQAVYDLLKEEQTQMTADINAELDLAKASQDIADKEAEIEKLKEKSMGAAITAPVAGTVTSLNYVAGETTKPEETVAVIQVDGKGYTMSISVTNEQARKVKAGDVAELQNAWYYEDVQAIVSAIKPDPDRPGQNKLIVFEVTGSGIQAGQALNISVGQRSSEYEFVVPNSAVREDNNGKFILIVESKSSPLGNRYIAVRIDVEVLASDDNNTAISSGMLYGYEYVITTSTQPVEAGKQVRLNE